MPNPIKFDIVVKADYAIVLLEIEQGLLHPGDLKNLRPPDPHVYDFGHKGVVLSGRGPVWLYGFFGAFLPSHPVGGHL